MKANPGPRKRPPAMPPAMPPAPAAAAPPAGRRLDPARLMRVPAHVKHLEPAASAALTGAFAAWRDAARGQRQTLARHRVWLAYLLLRHTGARLGEVLEVDLAVDLDPAQGRVRLGGEGADQRWLPVAPEVVQAWLDLAARLEAGGRRGGRLELDPGYLRRKFYERGAEAGLAPDLCSPRVLRNSRALELLRDGVPLTVVQGMLGQGSANLTAALVSFDEPDRRRILDEHLARERRLKTSARNLFVCRVARVSAGRIQCLVEMTSSGGHRLLATITRESLVNLGLKPGAPVCALIKAPWVLLAVGDDPPAVSAGNRLRGRLVRLAREGLTVEAMVDLADGVQVCALITRESLKNLNLTEGMAVWVLFKSSAVILTVD
ncbi:MAG: TOBE domain-containing protein [Pseudomonadota bacterium]